MLLHSMVANKRRNNKMGTLTRAYKNLARRKIRASLVVIALAFCMAILIAIPPGIAANQATTNNLTNNLGSSITQTEAALNKTLTQIDCSLTQSAPTGYGLTTSSTSTSGQTIGAAPVGTNSGTGPTMIYGSGPGGGVSYKPMNDSLYNDLNTTLSDVAAVEPILQVEEGVHNETITPHFVTSGGAAPAGSSMSFNMSIASYVIYGVPLNASLLDNYPILPTNITAGRNLEPGDTYDVLLSENNSAYFQASVGDTIDILGTNFTVVGIYQPSGTENNDLYMNLDEAQALTNNTGIVTQIYVYADTVDDVNSLTSTIQAMYPELVVTTAQSELSQLEQQSSTVNSQLKAAQDAMNQTDAQAVEEIVIAIIATSIIVLFVMLYTVRERTKEIGTLKAIGASNATVMGQFLIEGILLSLIAGLVGVAIGALAAPKLASILLPSVSNAFIPSGATFVTASGNAASTAAISVSPELMLIGLGASVLLGALGTLYPAWKAARTRPAEAMRYE